ncbi:MAG: hypothetical protein IJY31_08600, partial [Muribaculaceae bacterium]|nr:hypothetical protein [Muribaculaceae bacterium]
YIDGVLASDYRTNAQRASLREAIENKVCDTILPLVNNNDQDPLFDEYGKGIRCLLDEYLIDQ